MVAYFCSPFLKNQVISIFEIHIPNWQKIEILILYGRGKSLMISI